MLLLCVIQINHHKMRLYISLFVFLFMGISGLKSQTIKFGDSTIVSLITCQPGEALYAKFGHTAIRIRDTKGLDLVYNYGIFDFKTEKFYWKFLRGHTDYLLGVYPTEHFLQEYSERNSGVWEQELNMTVIERRRLIELLNINYLPENRMYRYNFVYDNCATRPYDIISTAFNGVIVPGSEQGEVTFREMIVAYLTNNPWTEFGINLIFGMDADRKVRKQTSVFLPEYLRTSLQNSKLISLSEGLGEKKVVNRINILVQPKPADEKNPVWFFHPFTISLIWLIIGVILIFTQKNLDNIQHKIFDFILYLSTGLGGLLIFFFMFFSEHPLVGKSINILWLSPINIILAVLIWKRSPRKFFFFYNIIYLFLMLLYILVTIFLTNSIIIAFIPLQMLLFLRILWREERLLHILFIPTDKGIRWR